MKPVLILCSIFFSLHLYSQAAIPFAVLYNNNSVNADDAGIGGLYANGLSPVLHNPADLSLKSNSFFEISGYWHAPMPGSVRSFSAQPASLYGYGIASAGIGSRGFAFLYRNAANVKILTNTAVSSESLAFGMHEFSFAYGLKEGTLGLRGGIVGRLFSGSVFINQTDAYSRQTTNLYETPVGFSAGYGITIDALSPVHVGIFIDNIISQIFFQTIPVYALPYSLAASISLRAAPVTLHAAWNTHIASNFSSLLDHTVTLSAGVQLPLLFTLSAGCQYRAPSSFTTLSVCLANTIGMNTIAVSGTIDTAHISVNPADGTRYEITYRITQ